MKKNIIFLLSFVLLTGCTADYDLTYKNGTINESLNVLGKKEEQIDNNTFYETINNYYNNTSFLVSYKAQPGDLDLDSFSQYSKKIIGENDNYGLNLNYEYNDINSFLESSIVFTMYNDIIFDNKYMICSNPKNIFDVYPYLDKITISFNTDKLVHKTTADKVKGSKYYWYIDRSNYKTKTIRIDFTDNILDNIKPFSKKNSNIISNIIIVIVSILSIIGIVYIFIRVKKYNK